MATQNINEANAFPGLIDLVSERIGGKVLQASDDFFAEKENLLKTGRGIFIPDKYTERGKWMDGWESRRKRTSGNDWCIIKLGCAGIIKGIDVDTNHFLGNNPAYASIDATVLAEKKSVQNISSSTILWKEILPKSPLKPGAQNLFSVQSTERWTHLRLNIFPDGGVARFRVYGDVIPDYSQIKKNEILDLIAIENGGKAVGASDMFFSPMNNLIMPGRAKNMGDGWETRRRRGPGYDWVILKLGNAGKVNKIEVDTNHFKGNFPDMCSLEGCFAQNNIVDSLTQYDFQWKEILPKTKLKANARHFFQNELKDIGKISHVRLNIFPDGGVSRLRIFGTIEH